MLFKKNGYWGGGWKWRSDQAVGTGGSPAMLEEGVCGDPDDPFLLEITNKASVVSR